MNYNYQIVFWGKFSALKKKRKLITALKCMSVGLCGETGTFTTSDDQIEFEIISFKVGMISSKH